MPTKDRIKEKMREQGVTQNALAKKAGLSQSGLSTILSGKARPREDSLVSIAEALHCSVTDLFDEPVILSATSPGIPGLSDEEILLVENFRTLSPEGQAALMATLSGLLSAYRR